MKLIKYLYRQSWKLLLIAAVCGLIGGASGAALIGIITAGLHSSHTETFGAIFLGLCLLHLASKSCSQVALYHLTQDAILDMRVDLSKRVLAAPIAKLQEIGKPELLVILTKDIETFTTALQLVPNLLTQAIIVFGCLIYMAWLSWSLCLAFAVTLALCLVTYNLLQRHPLRQMTKAREKMGVLYGHFRDLIEGARELHLNAQRAALFVDKVMLDDAKDYKKLQVRAYSMYTGITNAGDVIFYLVVGCVLFVIPLIVPYPIETLTAMAMILLYLIGPVSMAINALPIVGQAGIAFRKIEQLDASLSKVNNEVATPNPFVSASPLLLELKDVCHHYPGHTDDMRFLLGPMNLTVRQGEILFIIGGNGSGKTTLAMILLGLYQPESGTVILNGAEVNDNRIGHYRSHFSAVFADFHLFQHLIGPTEDGLTERAAYYLDKLGMAHKVSVVDKKFSTIALSSGQRKRLALVSAYLEDRDIYLFDEWAADQDPSFKRVFYTELLPDLKRRGKTVIVISHDDAYFGSADRVLKLEDGHLHSLTAQRPSVAAIS